MLGFALLLPAVGGCTANLTDVPGSSVLTVTPAQLCPGTGNERENAEELVACLATDVSSYWTSAVGESVEAPVDVDPIPVAVPPDCRAFLAFGTAFYCTVDATVYITDALMDLYSAEFGTALPYALAFLMGHEIGHVTQYTVGQPEVNIAEPTDSDLRAREQQADCLAGVWVTHAARAGRVNAGRFRAVAERELSIISQLEPPPGVGLDDYDEIATHGTLDERMAAYDKGVAGGDGNACGLIGVD